MKGTSNGWTVDLIAIGTLTVLTAMLLWTQMLPDYLVYIIGVPFIVFYPGYALMAAIVPEKAPQLHTAEVNAERSPTRLSRVALAIVLSPVLLGTLAILLSPWNAIALVPLLIGTTTMTVGLLLIAGIRRLTLPPHIRESITISEMKSWVDVTVPTNSRQNLSLMLAVILLVGVSAAAVTVPTDGEAYTEAYLLSETDDELVAANLPDEVTAGETAAFHVGIENHENEQVTYELSTVFEQIDEDGEATIQETLNTSGVTLSDEEQAIEEQSFTVPDIEGEHRVQVLIYEGELPDEPSSETADHVLQLQLTITADES